MVSVLEADLGCALVDREPVSRYRFFIGVDESNHGPQDEPEIVVAVCSSDPRDIEFVGGTPMPKPRSGCRRFLDELPEALMFSYLLLDPAYAAVAVRNPEARANVLAALVNGLELDDLTDALLYIDGNIPPSTKTKLAEKLLNGHGTITPGRVRHMKDGDRRYRVVSYADRIAYALLEHYRSGGERQLERFSSRRTYLSK